MHLVILANRLYFTGKIKDFRLTLADLAEKQMTVTDYIRRNLH